MAGPGSPGSCSSCSGPLLTPPAGGVNSGGEQDPPHVSLRDVLLPDPVPAPVRPLQRRLQQVLRLGQVPGDEIRAPQQAARGRPDKGREFSVISRPHAASLHREDTPRLTRLGSSPVQTETKAPMVVTSRLAACQGLVPPSLDWADKDGRSMFERFIEQAGPVVVLAEEEARMLTLSERCYPS
jgi:hypothetical protein